MLSRPIPYPPRPLLECKRCDYRNENPDELTKHLMQAHGYGQPQARLEADAENERLYPKFKAPPGKFSVLWVDIARSRGGVIKHCDTLEEAKAVADRRVVRSDFRVRRERSGVVYNGM